jgi:signal transduction histidine kinase
METIDKEPILYVDDEIENLQGFNYLLRRDFQVFLASSAKEGLEILKNNKIKVILTDQRMPEICGIEFLEQIRDEFPDVVRIIVTAYSDSDTILQSINLGKVFHFITKPWRNEELRNIIRRAIENYNLKQDKIELIDFLQRLNSDLTEAKERAEESDRLKSSFLANMSHEIRTPLNAIVGFSNLIISENDNNPSMKKQFYKIIETSSTDLLNIIEDILDTSRIETGFVSVNKTAVDLHKLMCDLLVIFQNHIYLKDKPVELKYHYPKITDKLSIITDGLRLKQIMSNLINNAIKFTEKGEIEFGFDIIENKGEQILKLFVQDTGIGIPVDKYDYIFERFRKLEIETDKIYRGNGLGLYIAKKLSQMLGGDITLESKPNLGSTFYVTIPYISTQPGQETVTNGSIQYVHHNWLGKTILVVEDEDSNYNYLEALLSNRVKLLWVNNGADALKIISEVPVDLVLMDIKLPKMDGLEATKRIKKQRSDLPVIAVTAYAMDADKKHSIEAGCDNYISKPYKMEDLYSLIDTYIV